MRVIIFINGNCESERFIKSKIREDDKIIAVDGGLNYVEKLGIKADFIVGDLDSVDSELINKNFYDEEKIITYPKDKNFTDLELALKFVKEKEKKCNEIIIFGGTEGRFDHYLGNIHALDICVKEGIKASIQSEKISIYLINDILILSYIKGKTISLIPLTTEVLGIKTLGLVYQLNNENLYIGECRGISNKARDESVSISILSGKLIVMVNNEILDS